MTFSVFGGDSRDCGARCRGVNGVTGGRSLYAHEGKLVYMYNAFTGEIKWVELDIGDAAASDTHQLSPTNSRSQNAMGIQ